MQATTGRAQADIYNQWEACMQRVRERKLGEGRMKFLNNIENRIKRLILTFVAKKYAAWGVSCWFLYAGHITGTDWCLLTAGIFAIDAYTKAKTPNNIIQGE